MAKTLFGILAGLLSGAVGLVLAYLTGVIIIAIHTKEFLPTVLASITVLPLMLLFVLLLPSLLLGLLLGGVLVVSNGKRSYFTGAIGGVVLGLTLISVLLPLVVKPQHGDFTSIVSQPLIAAFYGLVIGIVAARVFRVLVVS